MKVWDAATGQEMLTLKGHRLRCTSVAFSPDGRRIVAGGEGKFGESGTVVWDAATGREMLTLKGAHPQCYQRGLQPGRPADRRGKR